MTSGLRSTLPWDLPDTPLGLPKERLLGEVRAEPPLKGGAPGGLVGTGDSS